jgi:hypothetical protein
VFGAQKNKEEFLMTNTSFRKKALLSSVAMMLVALIALGSATFAWFATTPDAEAAGLKMTTSASTGIKVLSASERDIWDNIAGLDLASKYAREGILLDAIEKEIDNPELLTNSEATPAKVGATTTATTASAKSDIMQANTAKRNLSQPIIPLIVDATVLTANNVWYTNTGSSDSDGSAQDATWASKTTLTVGSNCYKEDIYVMTDGTGDAQTIRSATATWTGTGNITSALRVMLLGSDGKLLATWAPESTTAGTPVSAYGITNATTPAVGTISGVALNGHAVNLASSFAASTTEGQTSVTVVVYLDGEDGSATSLAASQSVNDIISSLTIELSTDTVA